MVLEGGSYFTDGEGTLITTEQCLLNPNRNPSMSKAEIEQALRDYLGVTTVVWLPWGHSLDVGPEATDGHVDGIAQYVAPGHVVLEVPESRRALSTSTAKPTRRCCDTHVMPAAVLHGDSPRCRTWGLAGILQLLLSSRSVVIPVVEDSGMQPALELLGSLYPAARSSECRGGSWLLVVVDLTALRSKFPWAHRPRASCREWGRGRPTT